MRTPMQYGYNQSIILMTAAAAYVVQLIVAEFAGTICLILLQLVQIRLRLLVGHVPILLGGHFLEFLHGIRLHAL